jgi:hypothetical protein
MSSLEAKVFNKLSAISSYQKILNPKISIKGKSQFFTGATPEWYIGWNIDGYNEFDVSASLIRLSKFGLIELMYDRSQTGVNYNDLKNTPFLTSILNQYKLLVSPNQELEVGGTESVVYVNEYGLQFKSACQ